MKNNKTTARDKFTEEYEKIMGKERSTTLTTPEWNETGNFFKKFSLYENYTPVKTSGHTILISE